MTMSFEEIKEKINDLIDLANSHTENMEPMELAFYRMQCEKIFTRAVKK